MTIQSAFLCPVCSHWFQTFEKVYLCMKPAKTMVFPSLSFLLANRFNHKRMFSSAQSSVQQVQMAISYAVATFNDTTGKPLTCSWLVCIYVVCHICIQWWPLMFTQIWRNMSWEALLAPPHADLLGISMTVTLQEMPVNSGKHSHQTHQWQNNTRYCQPCKAGDWHIKEWLLRTGDLTAGTCMSQVDSRFSGSQWRYCFFHRCKSHLAILSVCRFWINMSWGSLTSCLSNKFPSDIDTICSWIALGEARCKSAT